MTFSYDVALHLKDSLEVMIAKLEYRHKLKHYGRIDYYKRWESMKQKKLLTNGWKTHYGCGPAVLVWYHKMWGVRGYENYS